MKRGSEVDLPEQSSLKKLRLTELRALCQDLNVTTAGTKDVLIQRLESLRNSPDGKALAKTGASSATPAGRSGAATPECTSKQRGDEFFATYADESGQKIGLEGFMRLTVDLAGGDEDRAQLPETTILVLYLSWKMESPSFGEISKEGFKKGLEAMQCYSLEQIQQNRAHFLSQLAKVSYERNPSSYRTHAVDPFPVFYNSCFELLRPEGKKYVEKDLACAALTAIWKEVPGKTSPHIDMFVEFLKEKDAILSINADQWKSFVQFSKQVSPCLTGYTEDDPWPSLFDEYVAWMREKGCGSGSG